MGDGLDVHAAFGRDDEGDAADRAVDQDRQIELALDVGAVLDIEAVDLLAGRAGLLGDQRVAEHLLGVGDDIGHRLRQPHAALGVGAKLLELALAAAAGMDLALHHIERAGQRLGGGFRLARLEHRHAFGHRRAETLQQRLALIFMDVHGCLRSAAGITSMARCGAILTQASLRPCTAATELSNIFCSLLLRSISMMRSTPPAPITTGTPT